MTLAGLLLLAAYGCCTGLLFVWADRRFRHRQRLPMQWGFNGLPNWHAPRRAALLAAPVLGGSGFLVAAFLILARPTTQASSAGTAPELLCGLGLVGLAVYGAYLWIVASWDRATAR